MKIIFNGISIIVPPFCNVALDGSRFVRIDSRTTGSVSLSFKHPEGAASVFNYIKMMIRENCNITVTEGEDSVIAFFSPVRASE